MDNGKSKKRKKNTKKVINREVRVRNKERTKEVKEREDGKK